MIDKLIINIRILLTPLYWLLNYPYDKKWDKELNELLKKHKIEIYDGFTIKLGDKSIWVRNYPYAYGILYDNGLKTNRPSRLTIFKLNKMVNLAKLPKDELRSYKLKKLGI